MFNIYIQYVQEIGQNRMDVIAMMELFKPDELYIHNFNWWFDPHRICTGHVSPQNQKKQSRNYVLFKEQEAYIGLNY